jgi:uncharacterized protein with HEPN domain
MLDVESYETFVLNEEKVDAVIINLEQIGETVKKLSKEYKKEHPKVDWLYIAGLRNLIAHEYEEVDYRLIYTTAIYSSTLFFVNEVSLNLFSLQ